MKKLSAFMLLSISILILSGCGEVQYQAVPPESRKMKYLLFPVKSYSTKDDHFKQKLAVRDCQLTKILDFSHIQNTRQTAGVGCNTVKFFSSPPVGQLRFVSDLKMPCTAPRQPAA